VIGYDDLKLDNSPIIKIKKIDGLIIATCKPAIYKIKGNEIIEI